MPTDKLTTALEADHDLRLLAEAKAALEKADGLLKDLGLGQTRMELSYVLEKVTHARNRRVTEIVDEAVRPGE